jgi:hypothetical protein
MKNGATIEEDGTELPQRIKKSWHVDMGCNSSTQEAEARRPRA